MNRGLDIIITVLFAVLLIVAVIKGEYDDVLVYFVMVTYGINDLVKDAYIRRLEKLVKKLGGNPELEK